ncbi:hypothetical protein SAMN05444166_3781 [Singulisphaera sp. GP187]|uniref:carboxypeptidase-like regulatory domain-containing protein n=1 Tax=Singulisphaera sp. GP187 TaxID=1882752 RepID=UPI0009281B0B|nr:carboxypeptidase-like regulatory domain-containing protein [Singulisphaera sp. GP187]SIO32325.1 hypothetical protein SAMN05444166_3781 [Singulisphaera sp. GP187]
MKDVTNDRAARPLRATAPALALWCLGVGVGVVGCGEKQTSVVALAPVAGKVTLDEKPLAEAVVEFIPTGDTQGQGGAATTNDEGQFKVTTPFGEEGLTAGDYKVIVSKLVLPPDLHFDVPPDKNLPPADNPYQESLPPKYSDRLNSTLTIKVAPSGSDKVSLTLRSRGNSSSKK